MHPLLFIDFAMWLNPVFKVKVLKFVYDQLIKYRNEAGDAYRELGAAIHSIVPKDFMPKAMMKVGEAEASPTREPVEFSGDQSLFG